MTQLINRARLEQGFTGNAMLALFFGGYLLLAICWTGALAMVWNGVDIPSGIALLAYTVLIFGGACSRKNIRYIGASALGYVLPFVVIPLGLTRLGFTAPIFYAYLAMVVLFPIAALVLCKILFANLAYALNKVLP